LSLEIGAIIEQNEQLHKIVDIKKQTYDDGTKVQVVTTELV